MNVLANEKEGNGKGKPAAPGADPAHAAPPPSRRRWFLLAGTGAVVLLAAGIWVVSARTSGPGEAPEAQKVMAVQSRMPFQILIPAFLPKAFQRKEVEIKADTLGPSGEPMVELSYKTKKGAAVNLRQWLPINPDMEVLANSRPIQTKWGKGWLLTQGRSLVALWVDIGPLRVSLFTANPDVVPREQLLAMAERLGPASSKQVFYYSVETPKITAVPPPPPVEAKMDEKGVQEITLVITPGGYSPMRFAFKKDVPARVVFRQLGQVGCGDDLLFQTGSGSSTALKLASEKDRKVIDFTPTAAGEYQFMCGHMMFRGVMTVRN